MREYVIKGNDIGSGAIDFSHLLDAPAGKYGFVNVKDGHFYFENGKRIRFFGVNLTFGAAMPTKERAITIANRLEKSGINMVRLHHVDSYQLGEQTNTIIDYRNNSQTLHEENIDRLDFLISELKSRGIYIHIDLFTLRRFLPLDQLDYEDTLQGALKQIQYFNKRLIELHKAYAKAYLTHLNPYTGCRYIDEPAVAVIQLLNENSILWTNRDSSVPSYEKELDQKWNEWLIKNYQTREHLDICWTKEDGSKGLGTDEDPFNYTVKRPEIGFWNEPAMDFRHDYTSINGPARFSDHVKFLMEIQMNFIHDMKDYLRELGVKCPINSSNLPRGSADLRCVTEGDVTENNAYWNHPQTGFRVPTDFHMEEQWCFDPANPGNMGFQKNLVRASSFGKVEGKPFIITEWNACYPTKFRGDAMLMLASYGCLQDWDGMLLFAYSESANEDMMTTTHMGNFFSSFNDPAIWGLAGVASSIFLGKLVKPGNNLVELCYSDLDCLTNAWNNDLPYGSVPFISRIQAKFIGEEYKGNANLVINSGLSATGNYNQAKHVILHTRNPYGDSYLKENRKAKFLSEHRNTQTQKIWIDEKIIGTFDEKTAIIDKEEFLFEKNDHFGKVIDSCMKSWGLISEQYGLKEGKIISDTGELIHKFKDGQFIINTDQLISLVGKINHHVYIRDYKLQIDNEKVSISLLSKDKKPLEESQHILVTAIGECINSNMVWDGNMLMNVGTGPVLIDSITGSVFIPTKYESCSAYLLNQTGVRSELLTVERAEDGFIVYLDYNSAAMYFEVILH